jgi:hypothetical protein
MPAERKGRTHTVCELRMEPTNKGRSPSVIYCAEVRFMVGSDSVISVQDDGTETLHTGLRHASVKVGRSL